MQQNKPSPHQGNERRPEKGNVFIIILIGIVLFTGLIFTISRSMRSQTTSTMSARELDLAASDIISYSQRVERAINRLLRHGCSESDLSFEHTVFSSYANNVFTTYANGNAPSDKSCHVFEENGGKIPARNIETEFLDSSESAANGYGFYFYTGANKITGLGTETNNSGNELVMITSYIQEDICKKINHKLGVTANLEDAPPLDNSAFWKHGYAGSFNRCCPGIDNMNNHHYACVQRTGATNGSGSNIGDGFHYVHTLMVR